MADSIRTRLEPARRSTLVQEVGGHALRILPNLIQSRRSSYPFPMTEQLEILSLAVASDGVFKKKTTHIPSAGTTLP